MLDTHFPFIHLYFNLSAIPNIQFLRFARDLNTPARSNKYLYDTEATEQERDT